MVDKPGAVSLGFTINDKLAHGITFFMLALLVSRGFPQSMGSLPCLFSRFGLFIEAVQYFLPWRIFLS